MTTSVDREIIGGGLAFFGFAGALGIIGYQSWLYLKYGSWPSISLIDIAYWIQPSAWLLNPDSWYGIHKMLSNIPTFALCLAIGWLGIAINS